jgi:spore coat polysaccharide biosynthesis protein SpsF
LVNAFLHSNLDYLGGSSPQNHLPYGLGGEVFRVRLLRQANEDSTDAYDREHVTPWIKRHGLCGIFVPEYVRALDFSHLRCTMDDREDYERILQIFAGVNNPLEINWQDLMCRLSSLPEGPRYRIPYRVIGNRILGQMTLGTAQLGMRYGIVNRTGKPFEAQAIQIVRRAVAHGVTALDTARGYGNSERVLGRALSGAWYSRAEVITKLALSSTLSASASDSEVSAAVDASVRCSCEELQTPKLSTLLLHTWAHRRAWNGAVWRRLLELRNQGVIGILGASVYEPCEAQAALDDADVLHLQIPFNVLDWRWHADGIDQLVLRRPDVIVHARSTLLQGILAHPPERWPKMDGFDPTAWVCRLQELASDFHRDSIIDLCFTYVRSQSWISSVVVGCETQEQLDHNLELFCKTTLSQECCYQLQQAFSEIPAPLLNPAKWSV